MVAIALTLEPTARPNGLLSVLRPLPSGWERGVEVVIDALPEPDRIGPCAVGTSVPDPQGNSARFEAVQVRQGILCSLLGQPDTVAAANRAAEVTIGYALSQELYDGQGTNNPNLLDLGTSLGESSDISQALGLLEGAAEASLHGGLAVIHVPVDLAAFLGDKVYRDGNVWRTQAGNLVAIHGSGDNIYVTGEVWGAWGTPAGQRYDNHRDNTSEGYSDIAAIAIFDPTFVRYVEFNPTTSPTSP